MAIPVILRGETAKPITLRLADGYDYTGCTLAVDFCGVVRSFGGLAPGGTLSLAFTDGETAGFPLGTSKVFLTLRNGNGETCRLPWAKIKVTDSPDELRDAAASIDVDPATFIGDVLPARFTDEDVRSRLNAIINWMKRGAVGMLLALALPGIADVLTVQTAPKGTIYNDEQVVTNVTLDASGLATKGEVPGTVSNIVTKTYVEELGISGGGTSDYGDLTNKPQINGFEVNGNKTAADLGLATAEQGAKADSAYQKPQAGIPATDLSQAVQTSLAKADTALQSAPVTSVNNKTGAVALTANDVGAKPTQTPVPDPYSEGLSDEFISNITQTKNGVIRPVKKKVDFSKVATHALPFSLPEEFYPVDVWVPGSGSSDLYVTIRDPSLLTVVPNETGGGPYMLQYYNPDPDATDDLRGYIGLAVFDYNLEFVRTAQAGTLDFGGHNPYVDTVYLVAGGGGLSLLGTLVQHRLGYIPLDAEAVADAYDATSTYSVGDLVTHDGRLYECNTAISSPEDWNAAHWTEKKVGAGGDFSPLSGRNFNFATTQGVMDALKATIEALGGTVTNAPTPPAQNNQTQGE